jgi:hypothetical protein
MSRYLDNTIYSLDGNSIWEVALKFERLGLQEISKTPMTVFKGQDLNDTRAVFNFKMQFDIFFSLVKKIHVNGPASLGGLACFGGPTCLGGGASAAGLGGPTAGPSRASGWCLLEGPRPARPWLPLTYGVRQLSLVD